MKNVFFLISDTKNTLKPASRFVLDISEELYKKGVKVTIFSQSFTTEMPAYIKRRKISIVNNIVSFKLIANKIFKELSSEDMLVAVDFPMNIIASMVKNKIFLKNKNRNEITLKTIWYVFSFHSFIYAYNKLNFFNDILINLDIKHTKNIDLIKTSSKKIEDTISFINADIKNIETMYPSYKKVVISANSENEKINKYFVLFSKEDYSNTMKCIVSYAKYLEISTENRYRLSILGYNNAIKNQVSLLKIDKYVDFLQVNTFEETKSLIENAFAIIIHDKLASFDMNIYIAWNTKTIAIVDIHNALSEIVKDKHDAILLDIKNPLSLINILDTLSRDSKLCESIRNTAYEKLNKKFASSSYKTDIINKITNQ